MILVFILLLLSIIGILILVTVLSVGIYRIWKNKTYENTWGILFVLLFFLAVALHQSFTILYVLD